MGFSMIQSLKDTYEAEFTEISRMIRSQQIDGAVEKACIRYMCIRLTGLIEQHHKALVLHLCKMKGAPSEAISYIERNYPRSKGMKPQVCIELFQSLNEHWGKSLRDREEMQPDGKWASAIQALYLTRDSQAHGGRQSIGIIALEAYKRQVYDYLSFVENFK